MFERVFGSDNKLTLIQPLVCLFEKFCPALRGVLTWAACVCADERVSHQCCSVSGHKKSNVPQREGLSVGQRRAAVGPGQPATASAPNTVTSPSEAKTVRSH